MYADLQGVPKEGRTTLQAAMNPAEKSLKPCRNSLRTPWKISEPCKEHKMCYSGGRFTSAQRVTSILRYFGPTRMWFFSSFKLLLVLCIVGRIHTSQKKSQCIEPIPIGEGGKANLPRTQLPNLILPICGSERPQRASEPTSNSLPGRIFHF